MFGGWVIATGVLIAVVIVAVIVLFATRSGRDGATLAPGRVLGITFIAAIAWAALSAVSAIAAVLAGFAPEVRITIPVTEFWPQLPDGTMLEGMTADHVGGGFTRAEVTASDLSVGVRVGWTLSQLLAFTIPGSIAVLVAVACRQLRAGRPFTPVVARMATTTAVIVAVGGVAMQLLGDLAGSAAAAEILQWTGATYPDIDGVEDALQAWWPQPRLDVNLPFWPIVAGLGLAALGAVLRHGARLQRDTEGLV